MAPKIWVVKSCEEERCGHLVKVASTGIQRKERREWAVYFPWHLTRRKSAWRFKKAVVLKQLASNRSSGSMTFHLVLPSASGCPDLVGSPRLPYCALCLFSHATCPHPLGLFSCYLPASSLSPSAAPVLLLWLLNMSDYASENGGRCPEAE